jgi:hypothetical protein
MADRSLSASNDAVSVTIPAQYVSRFQAEATFTLAAAADAISEAADWQRQGKSVRGETEPRKVTVGALAKLYQAQILFTQATGIGDEVPVPDGDLRIEGSRATIDATLQGCLLATSDDLKAAAESPDGDLRSGVAEIEFWRALREQLA